MKRYWRFVLPAGLVVIVLVFLIATLTSNLVYFKTPTEVTQEAADPEARLRLGGQVAPGTVSQTSDTVSFSVTDGRMAVDVVHSGAPQQLFREGIGVVLEGNWDGAVFHSDTMLIKHDEQYRTEDGDYDPPRDGATDS
ncbi:MAG: cytochrome c maturation protein CcmE [Acidimicrobiia bacterium]|nr:cytochrome c maturation protein CcmE [Acidimicrobiia bacterium]